MHSNKNIQNNNENESDEGIWKFIIKYLY
jgi:hypothetical protein